MIFSKTSTLENLEETVFTALEQHDIKVISFDVFDTLIHRMLDEDAILYGANKNVQRSLRRYIEAPNEIPLEDLAACRQQARQQIASKYESHLDPEIHIDDWYTQWLKKINTQCLNNKLDEEKLIELSEQLCTDEKEFERSVCYPNYTLLKFCSKLKKASDCKFIFTSDMYLGKDIVKKILYSCGYGKLFDEGYVSGDIKYTKWTGNLYTHVLESENVKAREMLHIGDNPVSDSQKPKQKSIHNILLQDSESKKRFRQNEFDFRAFQKNDSYAGWLIANAIHFSDIDMSPTAQLGDYQYGPVVINFIHQLLEFVANQDEENTVDVIYFLAREGLIFKTVYDILTPFLQPLFNKPLPKSAYLCVSRLTSHLAAASKPTIQDIEAIRINTDTLTLKKCFHPYQLDQNELLKLAQSYGFKNLETIVDDENINQLQQLLDDKNLQKLCAEACKNGYEGLVSHLNSRRFFEQDNVVLVDVGWGGQIQENLQRALKERKDTPQITGFNFGKNMIAYFREERQKRDGEEQPFQIYAANFCDMGNYNWQGGSIFECLQLMEIPMRALHGTTMGYDIETGEPVFLDESNAGRRLEMEDDPFLVGLQFGLTQYAESYAKLVRILDLKAEDTSNYAALSLCRLVRLPTQTEAKLLLNSGNDANLGSEEFGKLGRFSSVNQLFLNPTQFIKNFKFSLWKQGFLSSLGWPAQLMYCRLQTMKGVFIHKGSKEHATISKVLKNQHVEQLPIPKKKIASNKSKSEENKDTKIPPLAIEKNYTNIQLEVIQKKEKRVKDNSHSSKPITFFQALLLDSMGKQCHALQSLWLKQPLPRIKAPLWTLFKRMFL